MILLSGNSQEPHITGLLRAFESTNVDVLALYTDEDKARNVSWDIATDQLLVDGDVVSPTACLLRFDFLAREKAQNADALQRTRAWYHTLFDWACAHEDVRLMNRAYSTRHTDKAFMYFHAKRLGLPVTQTFFTNDFEQAAFSNQSDWIVKHLTGEQHTIGLDAFMKVAQTVEVPSYWPLILQKQLNYPEMRIFRVGDKAFAFKIQSDSLDYRKLQDLTLEVMEPPELITSRLGDLMAYLGLDFGAADFKTDPQTGEWVFLELNSTPMFMGFCMRVGDDSLVRAIVQWHQKD